MSHCAKDPTPTLVRPSRSLTREPWKCRRFLLVTIFLTYPHQEYRLNVTVHGIWLNVTTKES